MKAIILAAGEGTRLRPITYTIPKPLIKIVGKSILEHNLENIYDKVDEIIICVKYLREKIESEIGDSYKGTKITYHEQLGEKGTGGAIKGIKDISGDIIIMVGDQIFLKEDIDKIFNLEGYGCLVTKVESPEKYGVFEKDNNGNAIALIEKPKEFIGNLANISFYKINNEIFNYLNQIELSPRGELEITDAISLFMKKHSLKLIEGEFLDVGYPWNILTVNKYFLDKLEESKIEGGIEEGVTIKGNIILEKGAILKSGTYIEGNCYIGKDCKIGPNCYIKGENVIGNNCHIGNAVEIKASSVGDNTNAGHLSYVGDSIIGNNVNLGAGFITSNLRNDGKNMRCLINGELVDTKRRKLGAIIGDNSKISINTSVYPARVIQNDSFTLPGDIIK